jgi:hypothetical protein
MAQMKETLQSMFHTIMLEGSVTIPKKRLIWALGWGQDRPGVWRDLIVEWAKMGTGHELSAALVWDRVILTAARGAQFVPVANWIKEPDKDNQPTEEVRVGTSSDAG